MNSASTPRRRKVQRISESKLCGTVNNDLAALLSRGGKCSRVVGPSIGAVHGDQQSRRSSEQNPSASRVASSELGHVVRRFVTSLRGEGADRLDSTWRDYRCVASNKRSWTKLRLGVMSGIRGKFPAINLMEQNSTCAEEVKLDCGARSHERKAC